MRWIALLAFCTSSVGCAQVQTIRPVTVVPTRTPGVAFVIVRPNPARNANQTVQPGDGKPFAANSHYLLLCDARGETGMDCTIPTEAAVVRYSYTPRPGVATAPVDEGIGTLEAGSTVLLKDAGSANVAAPAAAPARVDAAAPASGANPAMPANSEKKGDQK